jgi:superfamily II DNA/RNA helicase
MAQERRTDILKEFLDNHHSVLVTTNVLGRGVDLVNVKQARVPTT